MAKNPRKRGPSNEIVFSDFLRKHPLWLIVGVVGLLAVTAAVAFVVYPLLWQGAPASSSPEQTARDACQSEIRRQLDAGPIQFVDETADEVGENSWSVEGTAELGWSDRHDYACTYSGGEVVEANVG